MILKKCYISSFGKLHDLTFNFSDGINTVMEENGWGKSTLSYFIKAMFYGLSGDRKQSVDENERERFRPWNTSGKFGGYVEFNRGGVNYRIERFFGEKSSDDTVKLFNADTGKEFIRTENLGKRIFDIDEEGFFGTTYFAQKDFEIKSNSSLTEKFNSICGEDTMSEAFDQAIKKIDNEKKRLKAARGDKGDIPVIKREISQNDEKIARLTKSKDSLKTLYAFKKSEEERIEKIKNELGEVNEKIAKNSRIEAIAAKKQRLEEKLSERDKLNAEKNEYSKTFGGRNITRTDIENCKTCANDVTDLNLRLLDLEKNIAIAEKNLPAPSSKRGIAIFSGLSALCLCSLAVFAVLYSTVGVIPLVVCAVMAVAFGALAAAEVIKNQKSKIADGNAENDLQKLKNDYSRLKQVHDEYVERIGEFLSGIEFNPDNLVESLIKIERNFSLLERTLESLKEVESKIAELKSDTDVSVPTMPIESNLNQKREALQNEYAERVKNERSAVSNIMRLESEIAELIDLENKNEDLKEKLSECQKRYDILSKTYDYLVQADENLKIKYRKPLESAFNKYLKLISEKEVVAEIDVDLNVSIIEAGERKSPEFYSRGFRDLFGICKRFALIDVLFKNEKPFIILDDPFYNLDNQKLLAALDFIKTLSNEYQILYLVCHESRRV